MPTFNEYQNDYGYYIRAWTPNTGNINYKIREEGHPIVEDYDLNHGDDISWDTITSLKSLGLIYTDESGTIANDEFEPDPEHVEETALSEQEAQRLLDAIRDHRDLSEAELERLCDILGIDPPETELDRVEEILDFETDLLLRGDEFPTRTTLHTNAAEEISVAITIDDLREETQNGRAGVELTFISETDDELHFVQHMIFICEEHGIEGWKVGCGGERTWAQKGEVCRQKGHLLPILAGTLDSEAINPGSPEQSPQPEFVSLSELES